MEQPFVRTGEFEKGVDRYAVDKLIDFIKYTNFNTDTGFECIYDPKNNFAICGNYDEIIAWIHGNIYNFRKFVNRDVDFFENARRFNNVLLNILTAIASTL